MMKWLESAKPAKKGKKPEDMVKTSLPKVSIAQALVDVLKKPDTPPFTLTPSQICSGIPFMY